MRKTRRHEHLEKDTVSYVINSGFSEESVEIISELQDVFSAQFGNSMWVLPKDALHVTLMDWLAPFVDYPEPPDELFLKLRKEYIGALKNILQDQGSISVHFNSIKVTPITVLIQGDDDGSYNRIRNAFLENIELLPGTKPPPNIVHASIARFAKEDNLDIAENIASGLNVDFTETITEFRLVRETKLPMLEYEILDKFVLK